MRFGTRTTSTRLVEALESRRLLSFSPAATYSVGPNPHEVVTADFNHDGRLDVATANANDTVSVLLGDGLGGFGVARQSADLGEKIHSLAAADFNSDGKADLAWINDYYDDYGYTNLNLALGNGDGTFRTSTYVSTAWGPWTVATGDFNGDGKIDLAVSESDYNSFGYFEALLGDGKGGFGQAQGEYNSYPLGGGLIVGDLDRNGTLDVITLDGGIGGFSLMGYGDGRFTRYDGYVGAAWVSAVGDFTGDLIPDVVSAGPGSVFILPGRGNGEFDPAIGATPTGDQDTSVAAADFNGDGKVDAVTSEWDAGTVRLVLGNGNGTLTNAGAYAVGASPADVVVGDFNGDGRPDVAAANDFSNTVSVLLNDGKWMTKTYVGPTGGNWSAASNWSPAAVPGSADSVGIAGKSVNLSASVSIGGLTLTGGAKLNLNDKQLTLDYTGASPIGSWNGSIYTGITGMIQSGRNGGPAGSNLWNGNGIVTSSASGKFTTLGIAEIAGDVVVKFTYGGDANLDGKITIDDYVKIDTGVAAGRTGWINGDFNYDGKVNIDDYLVIDQNIRTQGPPLGSAAGVQNNLAAASLVSRPALVWSETKLGDDEFVSDELLV